MEYKLSGELYLKKILPCEQKLWPVADGGISRHGQVWPCRRTPLVHKLGHDADNQRQQYLTAVPITEIYKFLFFEIFS